MRPAAVTERGTAWSCAACGATKASHGFCDNCGASVDSQPVVTSLAPGTRFYVDGETIELLRPEISGDWSGRSESGRYYLVSEWPDAAPGVGNASTDGGEPSTKPDTESLPNRAEASLEANPDDDSEDVTREAEEPRRSEQTEPDAAAGDVISNADSTIPPGGRASESTSEPNGFDDVGDEHVLPDIGSMLLTAGPASGQVQSIVEFLGRVSHPSLPASHHHGHHPILPIQLLFIEFDPTSDWLTSRQLSPSAACRLGGQLAQLLSHSHAAGMVLASIRPDVIRWSPMSGRATLVRLDGLTPLGRATVPQSWGPATSPEVPLGEPATAQMDVFSLGMVLATGLGLEVDQDDAALTSCDLAVLNLDLTALIQRCVAVQSSDRPTLQHVARELGRLRGSVETVWAGATSVGRIRDTQEDSWGAVSLTGAAPGPAITFAAVADGMGGADAGEVASRLAIRAATAVFCEAVSEAEDGMLDAAAQSSAMTAAYTAASDAVAGFAGSHPELRSLASTLTIASIVNGNISVAHAGDSRCTLVRADEARVLTTDHTVAARLLAIGEITEVEAATHPQRSTLYRCLNVDRSSGPEVISEAVQDGDWLVLSSDGVHGLVSNERLAEVALEKEPATAARKLVRDAVRAGGYDNATAICIQVLATVP
jgi:serine/threonine protein phosphatase PrpC